LKVASSGRKRIVIGSARTISVHSSSISAGMSGRSSSLVPWMVMRADRSVMQRPTLHGAAYPEARWLPA